MRPRAILSGLLASAAFTLTLPLSTALAHPSPPVIDRDHDGYPLRNDCNDRDASIHPGAAEHCDGIDNNCDSLIDEGFDADQDGIADCFDVESCDDLDNNGDGRIDEGFDVDGDVDGDCDGATFCSAEDGLNLLDDGSSAVLTWDQHVSWTAEIDGAAWIWDEYLETSPTADTHRTISRAFHLPAGVHEVVATLEMAADNSYQVLLDGVAVGADSTEYNYRAPTDFWDLAGLQAGHHSLEFQIHNWALAGGTSQTNPGGLLYCVYLDYHLE